MVIKPQKTVTAILFGMVSMQILLPLIILVAVIFVRQWQKDELRENQNNTAHFKQLRISENDPELQLVDRDELLYKGVFYDVHSINKQNGEYSILALADTKETELEKVNAGQFEHSQDKKADNDLKIVPFVFLFYQKNNVWAQPVSVYKKEAWTTFNAPLRSVFLAKRVPPPWI